MGFIDTLLWSFGDTKLKWILLRLQNYACIQNSYFVLILKNLKKLLHHPDVDMYSHTLLHIMDIITRIKLLLLSKWHNDLQIKFKSKIMKRRLTRFCRIQYDSTWQICYNLSEPFAQNHFEKKLACQSIWIWAKQGMVLDPRGVA